METKNPLQFVHLRTNWNNYKHNEFQMYYLGTVAYRYEQVNGHYRLVFGYSVVNPEDKFFSKKIGRLEAVKQFEKAEQLNNNNFLYNFKYDNLDRFFVYTNQRCGIINISNVSEKRPYFDLKLPDDFEVPSFRENVGRYIMEITFRTKEQFSPSKFYGVELLNDK